ncbi:alpha/beta-hydrolase [Rhizodiscina lignyota]|uniref:Carboxylic ester hydrolase n=1 Tax=Rhizodiscina lignyota TaxID=1504668 RepID=A0A9P4IBX4_9PEZI|nr:alpha/beta-hydrolase [Rhizodiscina lignyota]
MITYILFTLFLLSRALASGDLAVRASTGIYAGQLNSNFSSVREFLNVPYGLSTSGSRRWLPPKKVPSSSKHYDSTKFPPSCSQYVSRIKSVYNQVVPEYQIYDGSENTTAGLFAETTSEDCLSLGVWTPADATSASSLPVALFMTGGGFVTGGVQIPYQLPQRWVSRTQGHVVVTINYRLNIMGFPNAAGLDNQNLGLLDQRLALEWVRDNIRYFGGDPSAITLWGQSAGSASTDFQNYAFYHDPIARAFFMQSGTVVNRTNNLDYDHTNFTFVAKKLGCNFPEDGESELKCMRKVPVSLIENFVGQYQDNTTLVTPHQPAIAFTPIADEKVVFANVSQRYAEGKVSKAPALMSTCADEGASLSPYPGTPGNSFTGVNQTAANIITFGTVCGAAWSSTLRHAAGLVSYRYQYAGNWSNVSPLPWMGPYHASDLPMIFGAYDVARGGGTELERETSATMEDYLLAFLKDPYDGPKKMGWIPFDPTASNGGTILRFGADGKTVQNATGHEVQDWCYGNGTYDFSP